MSKQDHIRSEYFRKGKTITNIAQEQNIDRKTVRKYVNAEDFTARAKRPSSPVICPKLDPFKNTIDEWLRNDKEAKIKQRHTAKRVYDRLRTEPATMDAFDCSYRSVATYVKAKKRELYQFEAQASLPLTHRPGEAQVDFGSAQFYEQGKLHEGKYLTVVFPYSNQGYQQLFYGENTECLLEGLDAIFAHIGGVPQEAWFDNTKTIVKELLKGGGRTLTERFLRFKNHYGFDAVFCNPNSGNEKGCVENKVGYHRRTMFVPIPRFDSLREYNKALLLQCDEDGDRIHYRKEQPIRKLFEADQAALLPYPRIPLELCDYKHLKADKYGKVRLNKGKHEYSTSPKFACRHIIAKLSAHEVAILDESYQEVVRHRRLYGDQKQSQMSWEAYLPLLSIRPRAIKYSGIYEMMPAPLSDHLQTIESKEAGKILASMNQIARTSGMGMAIDLALCAIEQNACNADNLKALHNRRQESYPPLPNLNSKVPPMDLCKTNPSVETFDQMLWGGRDR